MWLQVLIEPSTYSKEKQSTAKNIARLEGVHPLTAARLSVCGMFTLPGTWPSIYLGCEREASIQPSGLTETCIDMTTLRLSSDGRITSLSSLVIPPVSSQ